MAHPNNKGWSLQLTNIPQASRIAFKTSLGTSTYHLICGKICHILVELEHKSFQSIEVFNSNLDDANKVGKLQLN